MISYLVYLNVLLSLHSFAALHPIVPSRNDNEIWMYHGTASNHFHMYSITSFGRRISPYFRSFKKNLLGNPEGVKMATDIVTPIKKGPVNGAHFF